MYKYDTYRKTSGKGPAGLELEWRPGLYNKGRVY
jgi:hypothetical protein